MSAKPQITYLREELSLEPVMKFSLSDYTFIIMLISVNHPVGEEKDEGRKKRLTGET